MGLINYVNARVVFYYGGFSEFMAVCLFTSIYEIM
jgi:hypothetical protein